VTAYEAKVALTYTSAAFAATQKLNAESAIADFKALS
jgi:hypothetical protein